MADPISPTDPVADTQRAEVDPTQTIPGRYVPPTPGAIGDRGSLPEREEWDYYLRDGATPYRIPAGKLTNSEVFSRADNAWMTQNQVDPTDLWPSSANEIAGLIGSAERLDEPVRGVMPAMSADQESYAPSQSSPVQEADDSSDPSTPTSDGGEAKPAKPDVATASAAAATDAYQGASAGDDAMNEQRLRDAGMRIDLPFEAAGPVPLKYGNKDQQAWTPPPGFRQGMPPIDPQLAKNLGVERDFSQPDAAGSNAPDPAAGGTLDSELQEATVGVVKEFDASKHSRGWHGRFAEMLGSLHKPGLRRGGDQAHIVGVPNGHRVHRTRHGFEVHRDGEEHQTFRTAEEAARHVHDRIEGEKAARQAEIEAQNAHRENQRRRAQRREEEHQATAARTFYRFDTPENAKKIQESGELWGYGRDQGRGRSAVRAQPHHPSESMIEHERKNGRVLIEFHTKIAPREDRVQISWDPRYQHTHVHGARHLWAEQHRRPGLPSHRVTKLRVHDVRIHD